MNLNTCKKLGRVFLALALSLTLLTGPVAAGPADQGPAGPRPIVIQGPMAVESLKLAGMLENAAAQSFGPYTFWVGTVDGYPVIVCKSLIGTANSAAATVLAIERFNPIAIINQGTAGGHDPALKVHDIILGAKIINAGAIQTAQKALGQGSDSLQWRLVDWQHFEGAGDDALKPRVFTSDPVLLAAARSVSGKYPKGRVIEGTVLSSDFWNRELDRIKWFHDTFGSSAEEMEAAAAAQICSLYKVPFLSLRIISNNATNGSGYIPAAGEVLQDFTYEVVKAYIGSL
jgi:adenosylhomocysteine nucleosidase